MDEYRSNAHPKRERTNDDLQEERKKVESVVTSGAHTKKRSGMSKIKDSFISEDARNVKDYVVGDVLLPALKKLIYDVFVNGLDMTLFGGKGGGRRDSTAGRVSYRSYYDDRNSSRYSDPPRRRNSYSYDDVIIEDRGEAEAVLARMDEIMAKYKLVTVADFYDLCNLQSQYTDNKYGWIDIRSADVIRVRDGYTIKLPPAMPID